MLEGKFATLYPEPRLEGRRKLSDAELRTKIVKLSPSAKIKEEGETTIICFLREGRLQFYTSFENGKPEWFDIKYVFIDTATENQVRAGVQQKTFHVARLSDASHKDIYQTFDERRCCIQGFLGGGGHLYEEMTISALP